MAENVFLSFFPIVSLIETSCVWVSGMLHVVDEHQTSTGGQRGGGQPVRTTFQQVQRVHAVV